MVPRIPEMPIIKSDCMAGHYEFAGVDRKGYGREMGCGKSLPTEVGRLWEDLG
jgi:hypothetical protein